MTIISRRTFGKAVTTAALVAATPALIRSAKAQAFRYKFAHGFPLTHPVHAHLVAAAEQIGKDSNGSLKIEVFGSSQLGGDSQMMSQLRSGGVEFFTTAGLILSTFVPVASIYGMGFAFSNYDQVWKAIDGDLGDHIRAAFAKVGVHPFTTVWDNGFRQLSTGSQQISKAADLKGLKLRVPVSPLYTSLFKALGAAPVNINLGEVYSALQTQLVDGQENPLVVFDTAKFYEVQKNISETNHIWDGSWLLAGKNAWSALPKDLQEIVSRNFDAEGLKQRAASATLNASLKEKLTSAGIKFTRPDTESFKAELRRAGFYAEWRQKYDADAWKLLTKYTGELT
ncbi:tripartite ATP-independent transporter DctP family solute receptor [Azospirillum baldaniorum]|uniref:TRAP transporter substrate-binding protein n=1 Tax=Azospirillum baldaniorum TaxID=1064539 RepID=UPI0011A17212|nr:TRAP transporter substrate-binding protein [Azospirillum baldaniorum]TWA53848.1 tripartite ATP-independent transporter DctP family solute receptor [Azospirillum baldaniorum]